MLGTKVAPSTLSVEVGANRVTLSSEVFLEPVEVHPRLCQPPETHRFLARLELLLSREELQFFQNLYTTSNFTEKNPPYQAWLLLKLATLPALEKEAMEKVLSDNTPKNVAKSKKKQAPLSPLEPLATYQTLLNS